MLFPFSNNILSLTNKRGLPHNAVRQSPGSELRSALASEASDFVNGLILYVDGGILAYIGKQPQ